MKENMIENTVLANSKITVFVRAQETATFGKDNFHTPGHV